MQVSSQTSSPTVRVHQATPTPIKQEQSMLAQGAHYGGGWGDTYTGGYLSALPRALKDSRYHKRASSGSSIASVGPPSPLSQNTAYPRIATSDSTFAPSFDFEYNPSQSAHTIKPHGIDTATYRGNNYGTVDMKRTHSVGADDRASYSMSAPQSVSTMSHNSPSTPQTTFDADYEESKQAYNGENGCSSPLAYSLHSDAGYGSAAYQQSLQDVFPDQSFTPNVAYNQTPQSMQRLHPQAQRPNMMADRLQAAQQDHLRTNSPTSNPRDKSPFRQNSPYMPAPAQRPLPVPQLQKSRTSISPKELLLDEHDIDEPSQPLFPNNQQQSFFANRRQPSNLSTFYAPSLGPESSSIQTQQQFPMFGRGYSRESQSGLPDVTPDFPAHIISMESTAEEGPSEPSSQQSVTALRQQQHQHQQQQQQQQQSTSQPAARSVDTSTEAGTYSCTYHGCSMRFDSPAKLQKHKRDGHRQSSPGSASPNLTLRNSQAGPHRCDRINPSTGKPCNSVFSRPYDLTRHEDTIHNARKQKVRCAICTEEKTFSRNDALTRHMRVVHPDVAWEGKQKRPRK